MRTIKSFLPAIVWWVFSLVLFTLPGSTLPAASWFETIQVDKWVHAFLFLVLVYLIYKPFLQSRVVSKNSRWTWSIPAVALGYGVLIEILQHGVIPNRSFDAWDIAADGVGCGIAWYVWGRKKSTK